MEKKESDLSEAAKKLRTCQEDLEHQRERLADEIQSGQAEARELQRQVDVLQDLISRQQQQQHSQQQQLSQPDGGRGFLRRSLEGPDVRGVGTHSGEDDAAPTVSGDDGPHNQDEGCLQDSQGGQGMEAGKSHHHHQHSGVGEDEREQLQILSSMVRDLKIKLAQVELQSMGSHDPPSIPNEKAHAHLLFPLPSCMFTPTPFPGNSREG